MRLVWIGRALALVAVLGLTVANTSADTVVLSAKAKLTGFQESPPKLTDGTGTFSAKFSGGTLSYTLTYSGLSSNATQAHIHFAQPGVNGAVILWLCQTPAVTGAPAGTPMCPLAGGTVSRSGVTAADFITVGPQNFKSGDLNGFLRILRGGVAYANVHTVNFPGGEIRGLIKTNGDSED
jgi:hypothetical protein